MIDLAYAMGPPPQSGGGPGSMLIQLVPIALVLGIVTDFCIFYLSTARTRLRAGEERVAAARGASVEITPIVVASGVILAAGLASLRISSVEFFRDLGPALGLTVLTALVVSVVLMPPALAIAGRALFWPGLLPRNLFFLLVVLAHALRRALPPY